MPSLILDKSVVVAARAGVLEALRAEQLSFVLTDKPLFYEIATERVGDRALLSEQDAQRLHGRIAASLAKARKAADEWLEMREALRWEMVEGKSARCAPKLVMEQSFSVQDMLDIVNKLKNECLSEEAEMGRLASFVHLPEDDAEFETVRGNDRRTFFDYLEKLLSSPPLLKALPVQARSNYVEVAAKRGLTVSPSFIPDRGWLAYGIALANLAYLPWKFWRVGDGEADPRKPANPYFDILYIACMAIADGIISCDTDLLRLSWVCWPEKREHILRYHTRTHAPKQFQPDWV